MDTSEIYIKMCDCKEIRSQWRDFEDGLNDDNSAWVHKSYHCEKYEVWLPRQDQIQEMCPWKQPELVHQWLIKFFYFLVNDIGVDVSIFNTPEQLWLAFYMYEKYEKTWNGESWSKDNG